MNLVDGTLAGDEPITFHAGDVHIPLPLAWRDRLCPHVGQPVVFGVRPEAIALKSAGVPAQVIIAELMGADLLVFTQVGGQRVVVRADPGLKVSAGETVHLTFNENCLHVFSKTTQENLSI